MKCDAFLTMERKLLKVADHIERELGITVLRASLNAPHSCSGSRPRPAVAVAQQRVAGQAEERQTEAGH